MQELYFTKSLIFENVILSKLSLRTSLYDSYANYNVSNEYFFKKQDL